MHLEDLQKAISLLQRTTFTAFSTGNVKLLQYPALERHPSTVTLIRHEEHGNARRWSTAQGRFTSGRINTGDTVPARCITKVRFIPGRRFGFVWTALWTEEDEFTEPQYRVSLNQEIDSLLTQVFSHSLGVLSSRAPRSSLLYLTIQKTWGHLKWQVGSRDTSPVGQSVDIKVQKGEDRFGCSWYHVVSTFDCFSPSMLCSSPVLLGNDDPR